jgi:hypothetical protein
MNTSYSLEAEDIVASSLLRSIQSGLYYDIGAALPIEISNTYYFYQQGWTGLAVDGRAVGHLWEKHRPKDIFVRQLLGDGSTTSFVEFPDPTMNSCDPETVARYKNRFDKSHVTTTVVKTERASALWQTYFPHCAPDLVSLDVEGFEQEVLRGFDFVNMRPKLFIIELKQFNFKSPVEHPAAAYLYANDYSLVAKTPLDGFFIDRLSPAFSWLPKSML